MAQVEKCELFRVKYIGKQRMLLVTIKLENMDGTGDLFCPYLQKLASRGALDERMNLVQAQQELNALLRGKMSLFVYPRRGPDGNILQSAPKQRYDNHKSHTSVKPQTRATFDRQCFLLAADEEPFTNESVGTFMKAFVKVCAHG